MSYDWSRFSQKVRIKVPLQKVYDAWTTQKGVESWFLRMAHFSTADGRLRAPDETIAVGDNYHWRWHGHPDTVEEFGSILEANGKDRLRFIFGKAGVVTVDLKDENGATMMHITQEDIPTDEESRVQFHIGCQTGWTFYRANIKCVLEGISDARNKGYNEEQLD